MLHLEDILYFPDKGVRGSITDIQFSQPCCDNSTNNFLKLNRYVLKNILNKPILCNSEEDIFSNFNWLSK